MDIKLKNLGPLREAQFSLGDLTVICGNNNTGKTYATYALFGFLRQWREFIKFDLSTEQLQEVLSSGSVRLDLQEYSNGLKSLVAEGCRAYSRHLSEIFSASPALFTRASFEIFLTPSPIYLSQEFQENINLPDSFFFSVSKERNSSDLLITLIQDKEGVQGIDSFIRYRTSSTLQRILLEPLFPSPFIASTERTGTAIFRKELNFTHENLLKRINQFRSESKARDLVSRAYQDYALPVQQNLKFIADLESLSKQQSFIAENHPEILNHFADMIGGDYTVDSNDQLYYFPKQNGEIKLSMGESSSAVRSLMNIRFYLKHGAQKGDLLIVDEPELNLHPENQRRIARLFARLVNIGIKVMITTHSDYIVKELNTLIMLNHDKPYLKEIAEDEGYQPQELIGADQIKVYIAQPEEVEVDGHLRKTPYTTLVEAPIDPELGIEVSTFDTTINTMNRIQEAIIWGED
jgi:ABC-type transport system involved in cytochrome c biogenesis ATPase subunit